MDCVLMLIDAAVDWRSERPPAGSGCVINLALTLTLTLTQPDLSFCI